MKIRINWACLSFWQCCNKGLAGKTKKAKPLVRFRRQTKPLLQHCNSHQNELSFVLRSEFHPAICQEQVHTQYSLCGTMWIYYQSLLPVPNISNRVWRAHSITHFFVAHVDLLFKRCSPCKNFLSYVVDSWKLTSHSCIHVNDSHAHNARYSNNGGDCRGGC